MADYSEIREIAVQSEGNVIVEQAVEQDREGDIAQIQDIGGGYYRTYEDIGWGPSHSSLAGLSDRAKSATALCFKQSPNPVKFYKCNANLESTGVEL